MKEEKRKGKEKGIKMCYVPVPNPHKECTHAVLIKKVKKERRKNRTIF